MGEPTPPAPDAGRTDLEQPTGPGSLPGDLYNAPVPAENADPAEGATVPDREEGVASS